jgi:hypothetical protein
MYVGSITINLGDIQVLKATSVKVAVFWEVVPCNLEETDRRFRRTFCVELISNIV